MADDKDKSIRLQTVKITGGPKKFLLRSVEISHEVNEFAHAEIVMEVQGEVGQKFLKEADMKVIKITAKNDSDVELFQGCLTNVSFEVSEQHFLLRLTLTDAACLLNLKRASASFQKLDAKHEDILKKVFDKTGTVKFEKVKDKAIGKMILRLNETEWEFTRRIAGKLGAPIFTNAFAEKPMVTLGVAAPKHTLKITPRQTSYSYNDGEFQFFSTDKKAVAEGLKLIKEDFSSIRAFGCRQYLNIGDKAKLGDKEYLVKRVSATFRENILDVNYELVGKESAFFMPIIPQKNLAGRTFRAQVKKVEKDKIQAHLIDIDKKYEEGKNFFPFATAYSSQDGSGWYAMPEVDDYVRILFPSEDPGDAFAISSINTAPLKEPKNKSLKAPGGREILLTDKGVEIIAEHQKTFIKLDKDKGINIVSAKDIVISADGNISFDSKGKVHLISQKEITSQSGQSHVKILANQIAMGGSNVIVGE